jgi:hypothetical protein
MEPRPVLRALMFPGVCLALALASRQWLLHGDRAALAAVLALIAAAAIAAAALGSVAIATATKLAATGWLRVDLASRLSYRVALALFALEFVALLGVLAPGAIEVSLLAGVDWIELDLFLIFWCSAFALWVVVSVLRNDPRLPDTDPIRICGRSGPLEDWPTLAGFLERLCAAAQCPMPRHIVLGLEPGVFCTRRPVHVGGEVLLDGTLYVSLPLCRALSTSEFAALAAAEIARSYPLPADWAEWFAGARHRAERILAREPANPLRLVAAAATCPLRSWRDLWAAFQVLLARYGARRAAVSAGRENTAAAIAKGVIYPGEWTLFVRELQAELRRDPDGPASHDNLSRRFADRLFSVPALPGFLEPFGSENPALLEQKAPELAGWLSLLEVRPSGIAGHLAQAPSDPALSLIDGAASIEEQLSADLRSRVFFAPGAHA